MKTFSVYGRKYSYARKNSKSTCEWVLLFKIKKKEGTLKKKLFKKQINFTFLKK